MKEPPGALLDRFSRGLGRSRPEQPSPGAIRFYQGKRVLVTNGGEEIGPALARCLAGAGAEVTVHVVSHGETGRFRTGGAGSVAFRAGAIDREAEFASLVAAVSPDVVFHVLPLRARGIVNEADYMWKRNVRGCEALCAAVSRSTAVSVVLVRLWDESTLDSPWTLMAALGEALVLNHAGLVRASPKSVRVPSLLTDGALSRLARGEDAGGASQDRFAMLETEAAAFVADAGASCAGRLILVPADAEFFGAPDAVRAAAEPGGSPRAVAGELIGAERGKGAGGRRERRDARPLFPNEIPRPSVVPGAAQVVSPLCPAGASVLALVSQPALLGRDRVDECFAELKSELFADADAARSAERTEK